MLYCPIKCLYCSSFWQSPVHYHVLHASTFVNTQIKVKVYQFHQTETWNWQPKMRLKHVYSRQSVSSCLPLLSFSLILILHHSRSVSDHLAKILPFWQIKNKLYYTECERLYDIRHFQACLWTACHQITNLKTLCCLVLESQWFVYLSHSWV